MKPIELLNKHCTFETDFDCYVLFGIARKKNHKEMHSSDEVVFKEVIKNKDNIEKKYCKLKGICESYTNINGEKLNFYIYVSTNARDVKKGYITFKSLMLTYEREMLDGVPLHNQLKRLDSVWLSAIMKPESRSTSNKRFLVDVDTKDLSIISEINDQLSKVTSLVGPYIQETKNGFHYVTPTFNKQKFGELLTMHKLKEYCEVKTDALLFVENIN